MKSINTYLTFDGTCRDAMKFYSECLGGKLEMSTFAETKVPSPESAKNRIMHARITDGDAILMASDTMPGMPYHPGNNFSVSVQCETAPEADKIFGALSIGAQIKMPMQATFWAERFGMLTDKFGINWMVNLDKET